ncbi:hypothetical protein [Marilutibacter maris]|nr:hypothetical protein [Lysobacter maris]
MKRTTEVLALTVAEACIGACRGCLAWAVATMLALGVAEAAEPANYVFAGGDGAAEVRDLLQRDDVAGVQVVYPWKTLEPEQGRYDFSAIERDLAVAGSLDKQLFVQVQDRFFRPEARLLPDYLLREPLYGGGLVAQTDTPCEGAPQVQGWATLQWNPHVRERFQALLRALGERFDGRIHGINLPETAIDVGDGAKATGFTCDGYFEAQMENMSVARQAFEDSHVVQYVNFWPCEWDNDHDYMGRLFERAHALGIGLGGPDIVPYRRAQMRNAYPFFNRYRERLALVAMAVQEPTLTYVDPEDGERFSREDFVGFARDYLGVDIIFWSPAAPWLKSDERARPGGRGR